jgi:tetratricopeptide (TPR) repeat protein
MNRQRFGWVYRLLSAAMAALLACHLAHARYMRPDLDKIPVEQLIKSLETLADKSPKDATLRLNLARAHAMAFAVKTDSLEINKKLKPEAGAWFGYEPNHVPFTPQPTKDADKKKTAERHLEKAIQRYQETVRLAPDNLTAELGLAWCLDQAGKKAEAVTAYRRVIENAWKKEKDLTMAGLGWRSVTAEAAGYLTPLLDKARDADEIKELAQRTKKMQAVGRPITPLVIPLRNGLGVEDLVDLKAAVAFDADGSGVPHKWTWITKDAGWLVYDHRKSGRVESALQMFGSVTFWMFWENGYRALSVLDENHDGWLTGAELDGLAVWVDADGNGVVDKSELKTLTDLGIVALSCTCTTDRLPHTAAHAPAGVRFRDGTTRPTFDVLLYRR